MAVCYDIFFSKSLSNALQKHPKAQAYEKGWNLYEDVKLLMPSLAKGRYAYQANGLGQQTSPTTTTPTHTHTGESLEHDDNDILSTSPPPSPSIGSKRTFTALDSESVIEVDTAAIKYLPRVSSSRMASSSTPSTSTTSKRGRLTGAIALTTIGHGIVDLGASIRQGLVDKDSRHQDRMTQLERQLDHQELQLKLQREHQEHQELQGTLERQERQERQQKRKEAMDLAQDIDIDIGPENLAYLLEVFETEEDSARTYLSIKVDDVRKAWVKMKIARRSIV